MNIGLIGCGRVANVHMGIYKRIKDAKVVAIADLNPDRAKILAKKYRIGKIFTDYMDLLEIENLDFVDVCTPTTTHANIVCNAAKSEQNILVEKPMARSTTECGKMIAESKRYGVKLCVCHNQRFYSSIRRAKSMVDHGYYDVLSIRTSWKVKPHPMPQWVFTPEEGGLLWEVGCHLAYLQLYFLQNVNEVYALGSKPKGLIYDNFTVLLRTPKNSYGVMEFNFYSKEHERMIEINSFNGKRAQVSFEFDYLLDMSADIAHIRGLYHDVKRLLIKTKHRVLSLLREVRPSLPIYDLPHFRLISSFMDSLRSDSAPPVPPVEGKNTVKLLECIEKSLSTQRSVQLT